VVLTNSNQGADDIGFHLLNPSLPLAEPAPPPEERAEIVVAAEVMEDYVGVYELSPQFRFTVTLEDGGLFAQATGQPKAQIFPESETEFFYKIVDAQITFVRDETGEVTELVLHQGGQIARAKKVG